MKRTRRQGDKETRRQGDRVSEKIRTHNDLKVYQKVFDAAMAVFLASKRFPKEERYSLTDQVRRPSRSVSANLAEAWRKRRYPAAFVSKLSDAEAEAAETQVWVEFCVKCAYLSRADGAVLYKAYDEVISIIVGMISNAGKWTIQPRENA
jgi:four helix bundle protein